MDATVTTLDGVTHRLRIMTTPSGYLNPHRTQDAYGVVFCHWLSWLRSNGYITVEEPAHYDIGKAHLGVITCVTCLTI